MAVESDDYAEMMNCLGNTPHSGGHLGVGGIVSRVFQTTADVIVNQALDERPRQIPGRPYLLATSH